ncbi:MULTISPECIES: alpha/beta hydrolase [unclassified Microcoleus]|uniref:alpha/beta hydrolase n=1 Tax=unclassified Microcoleus TaxID=2642155 RepID=UPI002FCFE27D
MPSISNWVVRGIFWSLGVGLSLGIAAPGLAAKTVTILDGTNPVEVADLEKLANTGNISLSLQDWAEVLSKATNKNGESISLVLRKQLNQIISLDPNDPQSAAKLPDKLKKFLQLLQPGITDVEIQEVVTLIAQKANNLTVMDLLTKLPVDNLTAGNFIDALKKMPPPPKTASTTNILYMNSTRGLGTGNLGDFRGAIANTLENYQNGTVFDVDFVQTQVPGSLGLSLNSKPVGFYNQIWFDTSIYQTSILNTVDFGAINAWAANKQPEFILDSSFAFRNKETTTLTPSATAATINQALALKNAGGGILIGTDHNDFAYTANQILTNFGFDGLFTGAENISANGSFVGDLMLNPQPVGSDFFANNLQGLSTSNVPVGTHILNANGGDRTIKIIENLFSYSPNKVTHVGASFDTGNNTTPIDNPESVPEPTTVLGTLAFGAVVTRWRMKHKQQQKVWNSTVA